MNDVEFFNLANLDLDAGRAEEVVHLSDRRVDEGSATRRRGAGGRAQRARSEGRAPSTGRADRLARERSRSSFSSSELSNKIIVRARRQALSPPLGHRPSPPRRRTHTAPARRPSPPPAPEARSGAPRTRCARYVSRTAATGSFAIGPWHSDARRAIHDTRRSFRVDVRLIPFHARDVSSPGPRTQTTAPRPAPGASPRGAPRHAPRAFLKGLFGGGSANEEDVDDHRLEAVRGEATRDRDADASMGLTLEPLTARTKARSSPRSSRTATRTSPACSRLGIS